MSDWLVIMIATIPFWGSGLAVLLVCLIHNKCPKCHSRNTFISDWNQEGRYKSAIEGGQLIAYDGAHYASESTCLKCGNIWKL